LADSLKLFGASNQILHKGKFKTKYIKPIMAKYRMNFNATALQGKILQIVL